MSAPTFDIPKQCKAGVVYNEGPDFELKVEMVDVPEPGPNDVLLKLNATGICYSDIHFLLNDLAPVPMSFFGVRSPGHEGAGVVVKIGANVKNFRVGDRAGIKPLMDTCGACSYQQYVVSPARYATPIPDGVPDYIAAPIMCSASTMLCSLESSGLKPGNWACFPGGAGGVGIQGVQLAKAMGFRPIVVDTGADKKEFALSMGAEAFIDFQTCGDVVGEVKAVAGGVGAHGVFVTGPAAYPTAVGFIGDRVGGVIICIGLPPKSSEFILGARPQQYIMKGLVIKGSLVGTQAHTVKALEFARRGLLKQIAEVLPIDRLPEAVARLRAGKVTGRMVVDFNL
ncbi:alcohol dehydrogenase [Venturia nashicola]|nr:alcohol dehydrogenase [Venturia nashicola]